jgi:hypothetical protein
LAKNLIEGKQWQLYGTIPTQFDIVYNAETGEYEALFEKIGDKEVEFLLVSVLPV